MAGPSLDDVEGPWYRKQNTYMLPFFFVRLVHRVDAVASPTVGYRAAAINPSPQPRGLTEYSVIRRKTENSDEASRQVPDCATRIGAMLIRIRSRSPPFSSAAFVLYLAMPARIS